MMRQKSNPFAIVVGCHKLGLGVITALGEAGVPIAALHHSSMDMAHVSRYVLCHFRCPHPELEEDAFVNFLMKLPGEYDGGVLIPSDDASLIGVARNHDLLAKRYQVATDKWDTVRQYVEKIGTYELAKRAGVACPQTGLAKTAAEAELLAISIGFPCLVKPLLSHSFFEAFRRKMVVVYSVAQLHATLSTAERLGFQAMVQEIVPGDDSSGVNYNAFFVEGKPTMEVTARKVRLSPPRFGFPRVIENQCVREILEPGRRLLGALKYTGFACTEFKRDSRDGTYRLMEVNARQNLSTMLSVRVGVNFPLMTYRYYATGQVPESKPQSTRRFYWIDLGRDATESLRSRRIERYRLWEYALPYFRPHVLVMLNPRDPLPLFKRWGDALGGGLRILRKRRKTLLDSTTTQQQRSNR